MSDPTIWDIAMGGNPPEKFVHYADYARLKAEVEELKDALFKHSGENYRLQIQRERLTKAGDAMAEEWVARESLYHGNEDFIADWNAAKEGKPSA